MIQPGETLYIPHLTDTLSNLAQEGAAYARNGRLAQALLADQQENGGFLTAVDLQNYTTPVRSSIRLPYRGYELLLPPCASTGGVLTAFAFKLLAHFDLSPSYNMVPPAIFSCYTKSWPPSAAPAAYGNMTANIYPSPKPPPVFSARPTSANIARK
ncbi:MAG: gamma-glutamyltransferase [Chloroflexi bacterium]|nr:gamma-glutamyltransferase [Chloroflexota bacterium]